MRMMPASSKPSVSSLSGPAAAIATSEAAVVVSSTTCVVVAARPSRSGPGSRAP